MQSRVTHGQTFEEVDLKLIIRSALLAMLGLAVAAPAARADGWVTPFAGINFGGNAGGDFGGSVDDADKLTWGLAVGGMLGGVFGAEVDLAYSNNFFGNDDAFTKNNVLTILPTLIIGIPIGGQHGGGVRPYLTAGVGLLKRGLEFDEIEVFDDNDAVYSLGGGVMGYFNDHFGIRADYRYIRGFTADDLIDADLEFDFNETTFNFSRATIGAVFRF